MKILTEFEISKLLHPIDKREKFLWKSQNNGLDWYMYTNNKSVFQQINIKQYKEMSKQLTMLAVNRNSTCL